MTGRQSAPLWLVALLLVLAFAFQGTRGLWEPDEGRYSSAGLNMLDSGNYLVPTADGVHPHLTKPPLTYWALAASFGILGRNEWAARLPGAVAFVGAGLLVFGLGRRFCPAKPWLPALVYCLSLAPFMGANVVSTDILLTFFETASMYAFVRAYAGPGEMDRRWVRIMWLLWGLAFMTKGPPGLLPLFAMVAMLIIRDRKALGRLLDPAGLGAFAVVSFTWFAILVAQDPGRLGYFAGYEVFDRVFTSTHGRNAEWYGALLVYAPTLLFGALPWWVLATVAAGGPAKAWTALRTRLGERNADWVMLAWWFFFPLAIFCLSRSRLQLYILPLFVPLALMLARPLSGWHWLTDRRLVTVAAITALGLVTLKGVAGHVHSPRDARSMAGAIGKIVDRRQFDSIVFVGMRPYYGLKLYLGLDIQGVTVGNRGSAYSRYVETEDLCAELDRGERNVYAMKPGKADGFQEVASRCGNLQAEMIGRFNADGNRIALFRVNARPAGPSN